MNLAIDIDDVTVNITQALIDNHNSLYGTQFTIDDHRTFDLYTCWNCSPEEVMEEVYAFYKSQKMDQLIPVTGAVDAISELSKKHSITFISSRPDFLVDTTQKWMNSHFPSQQLAIRLTNQYTPDGHTKVKKSEVCKTIGASIIVEDSPANIEDCSSAKIQVLMFDRPWNQHLAENEYCIRVKTWKEIVDYIESIT